MTMLLACPKCNASIKTEEGLVGSQLECNHCGQWLVVGEVGAGLPVVHPHAVVADSADKLPVRGDALPLPGALAGVANSGKGTEERPRGRFVKGPVAADADWKRRKCAICGSAMSVSRGESHILDFFVPVGCTLCWECERCGKEVNVQSRTRILLLVLASPLLVAWWLVFAESSIHHEPTAAWWKRAAEDLAAKDSKGAFWFILLLLLFAMAPFTLVREAIVRLRYPRIV
jgi:hypothetical protein